MCFLVNKLRWHELLSTHKYAVQIKEMGWPQLLQQIIGNKVARNIQEKTSTLGFWYSKVLSTIYTNLLFVKSGVCHQYFFFRYGWFSWYDMVVNHIPYQSGNHKTIHYLIGCMYGLLTTTWITKTMMTSNHPKMIKKHKLNERTFAISYTWVSLLKKIRPENGHGPLSVSNACKHNHLIGWSCNFHRNK